MYFEEGLMKFLREERTHFKIDIHLCISKKEFHHEYPSL